MCDRDIISDVCRRFFISGVDGGIVLYIDFITDPDGVESVDMLVVTWEEQEHD